MRGGDKGDFKMGSIRRRLVLTVIVVMLVGVMPGAAWAAANDRVAPIAAFADAVPMSDEQLDAIIGELNPIGAGMITGAVGGGFQYATSEGEKSLVGLGKAVGEGALYGAVAGAATAVGLAAAGATIAVSAASTAWAAWGAAHAGAITGLLSHFW